MKFLIPLVMTLTLALGACSSSKKSEEEDAASDEISASTEEGENGEVVVGSDEIPTEDDVTAKADEVPVEDEAAKTASADAPQPPATAAADALPPAPPEVVPEVQVAEATPTPPAIPEAPPSSESSASSSGGDATYTVRSGDTLMKVAFEVYGDLYRWKEIYELNRAKISDPSALARGTKLSYVAPDRPFTFDRSGERYLIQNGDTLGSISGEVYGTRSKWKDLWERNKPMIKDPNRIYAGFYLFYEKVAPTPAPLADTAPAASPPRVPASVPAPPAPATASAAGTTPTGG